MPLLQRAELHPESNKSNKLGNGEQKSYRDIGNNVQYVQIARELTEKTNPVRELRVEYKKSALYGEILYPKSGEKDGWDYVTLENKDGQTCAIVALRFTNLLE